MLGRIIETLNNGLFPPSGRAFRIADGSGSANERWLLRWGTATPTGTPDAVLYLDTDATTTTTILYVDVNGTWTAVTIS